MGVGTGLMFFLDPNRGKQRRAEVRDGAKRASRRVSRAAKAVDARAGEVSRRLFVWKRKALRLVA